MTRHAKIRTQLVFPQDHQSSIHSLSEYTRLMSVPPPPPPPPTRYT